MSPVAPADDASTKVLKASAKYLIYSFENGSGKKVCKIANRDNRKLQKEAQRIIQLQQNYPLLNARLPRILDHDTFRTGIHAGKHYYIQEFFPGQTLSSHVQSQRINTMELEGAFEEVLAGLLDITEEHVPDTVSKPFSHSGFLQNSLQTEYTALIEKKNVGYLAQQEALTINGHQTPSLRHSLDRIFNSPAFEALKEEPAFISALGHWNFHGDNIMIDDLAAPDSFKIIDPDVSLDTCDPLFSVARFFYTFPHDTADYHQYLIHSWVFVGGTAASEEPEFLIDYLWPKVVFEKYSTLFGSIWHGVKGDAFIAQDPRLEDPKLLFRLKLNFLYCLIRGANVNYSEKIDFVDRQLTDFRNKAIFLYLQAAGFAAHLGDFAHEQ